MKESALQRAIVLALEAEGCYVTNVVVAGRKGTPDLICCVAGRFVAFEVKRPGEHPTPLQIVEAQRVVRAGGEAWIVTDVAGALAFVKAIRALPLVPSAAERVLANPHSSEKAIAMATRVASRSTRRPSAPAAAAPSQPAAP